MHLGTTASDARGPGAQDISVGLLLVPCFKQCHPGVLEVSLEETGYGVAEAIDIHRNSLMHGAYVTTVCDRIVK